jgi:flagellar export protein FliJ
MKPFQFRLATLLKLREQARDERRNRLAEAYRAEQTLAEHRAAVQAEADALRAEYGSVAREKAVNVDRLLDNHRYQLILAAQLANIDVQARKLADEIERRRIALVAADRDVRVLERLRETQRDRHRKAAEAWDQKQFDEIASLQFVAAASTQEAT